MGNWIGTTLKNFVEVESGFPFKSESFLNEGIPVVKIANISNYKTVKSNDDSFINPEDLKFYKNYILSNGDILIAMSGNTTCKMGRVTQEFSPSLVNQRVGWIKPISEDIDINYIYYLLTSETYQNKLWNRATATGQPNLSPRDIKRIFFQKPPKPEQTAIAAVLSKVDEAIAAVEASIKSAERLKKALMQNLLTGKLKPNGERRKDDEFYTDEKFGKVPIGWEVKRLKNVFDVNGETLPSRTDPNFKFRYITIESVMTEKIDFENCPEYKFGEAPGRARRIIKSGDILISGVRPNLKAFAIYQPPNDEDWICSTGFYVLRVKENQHNLFHFYQILSFIGERQFHSYVAGTNYPAIGDSDIKGMNLFCPSYGEQSLISEKFESLSETCSAKQAKIQTLQRLKKSLMQNLLTGKRRVDVEKIERLLAE